MTTESIARVRELLDGPAQRVWINGVRHWISIEDEDEPFRIGRGQLSGLVPGLAAKPAAPVVKPTCAECGGPVSVYALRCRKCARIATPGTHRKSFEAPVLPQAKRCLDCPASLSVQTGSGVGPVRCQRCAAKERWRLKRAAMEASA